MLKHQDLQMFGLKVSTYYALFINLLTPLAALRIFCLFNSMADDIVNVIKNNRLYFSTRLVNKHNQNVKVKNVII